MDLFATVQRAATVVGVEHAHIEPLLAGIRGHISSSAISHHIAHHSKVKVKEQAVDVLKLESMHKELQAQGMADLDKFTIFLQRVTEEKAVSEMLRLAISVSGKRETPLLAKAKARAAVLPSEYTTLVPLPTAKGDTGWLLNRPYLSGNYLTMHEELFQSDLDSIASASSSLGALPVAQQEVVLVTDLIRVLSGVEGVYIRSGNAARNLASKCLPSASAAAPKLQRPKFSLPSRGDAHDCTRKAVDPSLRELAQRLLPLGESYLSLSCFVHARSCSLESGLVMHAFCAALRGCLQEHLIGLAQLEQQHNTSSISLQQLWYYLQPAARSLAMLDELATMLGSARGGALLKALFDRQRSLSGDVESAELLQYFVRRTAVPFLDMLDAWVHKGVLRDPYGEFMVVERPGASRDDLVTDFNCQYWQRRFVLAPAHLPTFLELHAEQVLTTGKSLHVVRESRHIDLPAEGEEGVPADWQEADSARSTTPIITLDERSLAATIQEASSRAASQLISLLMLDHKLMARLESIKHYFLLDQVRAPCRPVSADTCTLFHALRCWYHYIQNLKRFAPHVVHTCALTCDFFLCL